jgi:hypothetical protein
VILLKSVFLISDSPLQTRKPCRSPTSRSGSQKPVQEGRCDGI